LTQSRLTGLWRNPDFLKLWSAQTVSELGSWVTGIALPLTAQLVLDASALELGLLGALGTFPVVLMGLVAGVWVDRLRRRPILILADLLRALLLFSIPAAHLLGRLTMAHLYFVAALTGALTVLFDVSYRSYLPSLVERKHLVEGNSKLSFSGSVAEVGGPGLGGTLVQLITAPFALLVDAFSFLFSALFLGLIRKPEPPPSPREEGSSVRADIAEGLRLVQRSGVLRAFAGATLMQNFFGGFFILYNLFVLDELGLSSAELGLLVSAGGVGGLVGAMAAGPLTRRLGVGRALISSLLFVTTIGLLIPFVGGPPAFAFAMMFLIQLVGDAAWPTYHINEMSLRQSVTPDRLLGRVNASMNVIEGGSATVGALLGGLLGNIIGLRPTLGVAVVGLLLSSLWLFFSPVRVLREHPEQPEAAA
jgi:predicted MFS family arabinose efflux permease